MHHCRYLVQLPVMLVLLTLCLGAAPKEQADPPCPKGTVRRESSTEATGESARWCEKPDGTRHGPASMSRHDPETGEEESARGEYKDGKRHGFWKLETHEGGESGHYDKGLKEGSWTEWFLPEGVGQGHYRADQKHGIWTWWFDDGRTLKAAEIPYRKGVKHGRRTNYGPNIPPKYIDYKDGKEVAAWDADGKRMHDRSAAREAKP